MVRKWIKFNEDILSNGVKIIDNVINKLQSIREIFIEFEDDGKIWYDLQFIPYNHDTYLSLVLIPENGMDTLIKQLNKLLSRFDLKDSFEIVANIKIPSNRSYLTESGVKDLSDIITSMERLKHLGFEVRLNINDINSGYKPITVIISLK